MVLLKVFSYEREVFPATVELVQVSGVNDNPDANIYYTNQV